MKDERKISIAIPTYNRYQQTIDSFKQVLDDERVEEAVISDDCSTDDSCERLVEYFNDNPKVKVFRNKKNEDCYRNKCIAMSKATSEFCILFDSDNTLTTEYLDALYAIPEWDKQTAYQPEFSFPHFDFRNWRGLLLTRKNVAGYVGSHLMTALNAMNFFISREEFLRVWDGTIDPVTSDSIFFAYTWIKSGGRYLITPNLQYEHFIDPNGNGHYQKNYMRTGNFHQVVLDKIKKLQ